MENESHGSLTLEEKIEEHKAFLRYCQRLMGPEWFEQIGGLATIDRQLIMIDALVTTAQAELQQYYNVHTLAHFLSVVFITVRDDRVTADPRILAVEAEYQRRGGTGVNRKHNVVLFTTGNLYEHISGKGLSSACKEEKCRNMNRDHLRSNGHSVLVQRKPKRVDYPRLLVLGRELLLAIGEDPEREGLRETPRRWADSWREFMEYDPGTTGTTFSSVASDQMVCVSGIRVASLCEHHLLPFWCDVSIGYIPDEKVLGLSKFARIAQQFAHGLQLQEQLGHQIADEITQITGTQNVAVVLKGEHYCMAARGIRSPGRMASSVMRGVFRTESQTRMEFLRLIE